MRDIRIKISRIALFQDVTLPLEEELHPALQNEDEFLSLMAEVSLNINFLIESDADEKRLHILPFFFKRQAFVNIAVRGASLINFFSLIFPADGQFLILDGSSCFRKQVGDIYPQGFRNSPKRRNRRRVLGILDSRQIPFSKAGSSAKSASFRFFCFLSCLSLLEMTLSSI